MKTYKVLEKDGRSTLISAYKEGTIQNELA